MRTKGRKIKRSSSRPITVKGRDERVDECGNPLYPNLLYAEFFTNEKSARKRKLAIKRLRHHFSISYSARLYRRYRKSDRKGFAG